MTYTAPKRLVRLFAGLGFLLTVVLLIGSYSLGYSQGADRSTTRELRKINCRGELNGPASEARDDGQVAFNYALPAYVAGDNAAIERAYQNALGEGDPEVIGPQKVVALIEANARYEAALIERGDVAKRCADGDPDD